MAEQGSDRKVLVAVDFSSYSRAALMFAAELAADLRMSLVVLHVVHDPAEAPGYYRDKKFNLKKGRLRRLEEVAEEMMETFLARACKEHPHLAILANADTKMVLGLPVTRILQVAEKIQPLMIVMGSQGRTGLPRLMLGSKSEQVIKLSPIPVTVVRRRP